MEIRFVLLAIIVTGNVMVVFPQKYNTLPVQLKSLSTRYAPKVAAKLCLLKPDEGPCRGSIRMYYFDPETKECDTFTWGGCQGNGNRFDKKSDCEKACLTQPGASTPRPRYCQLTFDYGFCFGAVKRWYFDRMWKVCKETIYSGCGGNKNNFYGYEQCDSICRLGKGSLSGTKGKRSGIRKVIYVYSNITTRPTTPEPIKSRATSPRPRSWARE